MKDYERIERIDEAPTNAEVSEAWKARRFRWRVIEGKRKKVFQTREEVETDGAKLCRCPVCFLPLEWRGNALVCPKDGCEGAWIEY